jgi:integrase
VAALPTTGYRYPTWDTVTPNMGVIVYASGVKTYIVQRRLPGQKNPKSRTIGRCSGMSLALARKKAEEFLYKMGLGLDPRVKDIQFLTLREGMEKYLLKDKPKPLRESSKSLIRALIEGWLNAWLDSPPLISIDHDMVDKRHSEIRKEIEIKPRKPAVPGRHSIDGKATANGVMRYLSSIWNYNLKTKAIGVNPVVDLVMYVENKVNRAIPKKDHAAFYRAILVCFEDNPWIGGAMLVAMFTGFRKENVQELLWAEIGDLFIEIPADKVKNGEAIKFPINSLLRWVFNEIERRCGRHPSGYVFPPQNHGATHPHFTGLTHKIRKVGEDIGLVLSAHDLRHTEVDPDRATAGAAL